MIVPEFVYDIALIGLGITMALGAVRAFLGPRTVDRSIAADLIFFGIVGLVTLIGLRGEADALFDIILIATLLGFAAPVSMARLTSGGQR